MNPFRSVYVEPSLKQVYNKGFAVSLIVPVKSLLSRLISVISVISAVILPGQSLPRFLHNLPVICQLALDWGGNNSYILSYTQVLTHHCQELGSMPRVRIFGPTTKSTACNVWHISRPCQTLGSSKGWCYTLLGFRFLKALNCICLWSPGLKFLTVIESQYHNINLPNLHIFSPQT